MSDNPPSRYPDRPISAATHPWWVVHVKPRQEKAIADDLRGMEIEYYLPLVTKVTRRRDSNKPRKSIVPLFPGYISYSGDRSLTHQIYAGGRVAEIIEVRNQKHFVRELDLIYSLLEKGFVLEPYRSTFTAGMKVMVQAGPLKGIQGTVVKAKNQSRLILNVEGLGRAALTVDAAQLRPV